MAVKTAVNSDLADAVPRGRKFLLPIGGLPAVAHLVNNLRQCESVSRVILVTDMSDIDGLPDVDVMIEAPSDLTQCVLTGIRAADSDRCLIMNGDMPMASADAISDMLKCSPNADVIYPIVEETDVKDVFPERSPFYVTTKEGRFTGSSCLLFRPDVALAKEKLIIKLLDARSDPKQLLGLVGPFVAMKFMMSTLALSEFEHHLSKALNLDCRVFITHFPELLMSIDSRRDIALIEKELGNS